MNKAHYTLLAMYIRTYIILCVWLHISVIAAKGEKQIVTNVQDK